MSERGTFGFVLHPLDKLDVARKYPIARLLPERWVEWLLSHKGPMRVSHISGVRGAAGAEAEGWFVGVPLTARQQIEGDVGYVTRRIIETIRVLERETPAKIVGLGAYTAVVGDAGKTIQEHVGLAVTTGNSYTVATGVEGALLAAEQVGIDRAAARAGVMGATGSIGRVSAMLLSEAVPSLVLIGRDERRLQAVLDDLPGSAAASISTDADAALPDCDIVITVTSALDAVVHPHHLKRGAVVCDISRPRDVSRAVARQRPDVLVIEGGVVETPGSVDFGFDFGFPPRTCYACMAETMVLALERRYESFSLGRRLDYDKVKEIDALARKHGFRLAGFRSFEKQVSDEQIARVRAARQRVPVAA